MPASVCLTTKVSFMPLVSTGQARPSFGGVVWNMVTNWA